MDGHRSAERRSLALHHAVAERLADPAVLDAARSRIASWRGSRTVHPEYVEAWAKLLDGPQGELRALLLDPGERGCTMRQTSPFAGVLSARERWRIIKSVA